MANRRTSSRSRDSGSKKKQHDNENLIEVLFHWQDHRSVIKSKRSELLDRITEIFVSFSGKEDVQIHTLQSSRTAKGKQRKYLLQHYVTSWKAYINVDSIDQVKDRDNLTITQPSAVLSSDGFDSSSTQSVPVPSQNKIKVTAVKEAACAGNTKCTKSRVTGVNVFLLQQYTPGSKVPKNDERVELKRQRNKTVYISRNDDATHVEEKIKLAFGLQMCNKYTVLESDSKGCNLFVSPLQYLSGNQAIKRRKGLYLCEEVVDDENNLQMDPELSDISSVDNDEELSDDFKSDVDLPVSGVLLPSEKKQRKLLSSRFGSFESNNNSTQPSTIPPPNSCKRKGKQLKVPYSTGERKERLFDHDTENDESDIDSNTDISLPLNSKRIRKQLKASHNVDLVGESDGPSVSKSPVKNFVEENDESDIASNTDISLPLKRKRKRKQLKVSQNVDLVGESDGPSVSKRKNLVEPVVVINVSSDEEKQELMTEKSLSEWRALRKMQDKEFEESAAVDKLKEKDKEVQLKRQELQQKYVEKWGDCLKTTGGLKLSIRLPDGQKVDCCLPRNATAKMIYEIAFGIGGISKPFSVYTIRPRKHIRIDSQVSEVLSVPQTLIIEEDESAVDPILILDDGSQTHTEMIVQGTCTLEQGTSSKCIDVDVSTDCIERINSVREIYMTEKLATHEGEPRCIQRATIYADVLDMFMKNLEHIKCEYPFRIQFFNERAIDTGGVCRDMYSCFWEHAYIKHFDGDKLLIPAVHAISQISVFPILGTILAHGFFACNFLPVRLAFPIIAAVLRGTDVNIPDWILSESLIDFLSEHDGAILHDAIQFKSAPDFPNDQKSKVIGILSRFECSEIPTPFNLKALLISVAKFQFLVKPLGLLYAMRSGIPKIYIGFWEEYTIEEMFNFYRSLNATPSSVINLIQEPELTNAGESRVYNYLLSLIGNMKQNELRLFLRFTTGSAVLLDKPIKVSFNSIGGLARRPISHTCDCRLELSISYFSYPDFEDEFLSILHNELSWEMHAI